jgi:hypothetical protein
VAGGFSWPEASRGRRLLVAAGLQPAEWAGCKPAPTAEPAERTGCKPAPTVPPAEWAGCKPAPTAPPAEWAGCKPAPTAQPAERAGCKPAPTVVARGTRGWDRGAFRRLFRAFSTVWRLPESPASGRKRWFFAESNDFLGCNFLCPTSNQPEIRRLKPALRVLSSFSAARSPQLTLTGFGGFGTWRRRPVRSP